MAASVGASGETQRPYALKPHHWFLPAQAESLGYRLEKGSNIKLVQERFTSGESNVRTELMPVFADGCKGLIPVINKPSGTVGIPMDSDMEKLFRNRSWAANAAGSVNCHLHSTAPRKPGWR